MGNVKSRDPHYSGYFSIGNMWILFIRLKVVDKQDYYHPWFNWPYVSCVAAMEIWATSIKEDKDVLGDK